MTGMKISIAASLCGHPHKWARAITPTTAKPKFSISPINNTDTLRWCRITPCAPPISLPAHDTNLPRHCNALGFNRIHIRQCASLSGSGSGSGSGLVGNTGSEDKKKQESSKLITLPTILTLGRVAAVPLLISTFYMESWWGTTATTSIFIAASVTDWLDGYLARKMKLGSTFGAFLDPVADKLMVAATLVLLCSKPPEVGTFGQIPWLLTVPSIAIIGREITMSAVREWAASQNSKLLEAVAVNNLGKWKTATQMTALTLLLATRDSSLGGSEIAVASSVVLLYVSAGLAVMSLVSYMKKIWKVLLK